MPLPDAPSGAGQPSVLRRRFAGHIVPVRQALPTRPRRRGADTSRYGSCTLSRATRRFRTQPRTSVPRDAADTCSWKSQMEKLLMRQDRTVPIERQGDERRDGTTGGAQTGGVDDASTDQADGSSTDV